MNPLDKLPLPLLEWFRDNARSLPWRDDPTPYHVWLSEIMLQQTRVAAVLDYYQRFLEEAPDISALAALPACLLVGTIAIVPAMISSKFSRWQGVALLVVYLAYVIITCFFIGA